MHRVAGPCFFRAIVLAVALVIPTGCGTAGQVTAVRLFGAIVERDGQFKFVNYASDF